MKRLIFTAIIMAAGAFVAGAGEPWTLAQCVDYAVANNLTLKSSRMQVRDGELSVTAAKDAFLPTVSGNASEGFNFGRGLTAYNTYADRNTSSFQWGVGLNLPLFQGLQNVRQLKVARAQLSKYLLDCDAAKDDLTLNIISEYLQVLYNKELVNTARSQLDYSTYEVERQKALIELGKVAEADLYDIESQQAQDRLQMISAENDVRVALVNLANLLQLPSADGFDVAPLNEDDPEIPGPDVIYSRALEHNSGVLSARQSIEVAKANVSLAKSGYMPKLSFSASVGSSYYTLSGSDNDAFSTQMRNNFSTYLGFSLQVPIFDAFSSRNNVRRARLQQESAALELDRRESDLYKAIQLAYTQATGARDKYLTSAVTLEKTQKSFDAVREKYSMGRTDSNDFETAKNNLFKVEVSRITAHYEYLLRYRILRYYETNRL